MSIEQDLAREIIARARSMYPIGSSWAPDRAAVDELRARGRHATAFHRVVLAIEADRADWTTIRGLADLDISYRVEDGTAAVKWVDWKAWRDWVSGARATMVERGHEGQANAAHDQPSAG